MERKEYISQSSGETARIGAELAATLQGGEVIAFTGGMGMGKTAFTRGLVLALNGEDVVSSPTFALVNEYRGKFLIEHFDMYRIEGWADLYSTGFFDYLDTDSILIIEWSENIEAALPEYSIRVAIQPGDHSDERKILITDNRKERPHHADFSD